ncbi:MAG: hypothetical protein P4L81_02560, partial [Candidatus Pacebacteria bacterium]|nr:hypothetical protein [Candidatus Paceibacterota bacterium]
MQEIFLDGAKYISAGDAAAASGFSRDYITRLARDGKILGRQIDRQWYVSHESLNTFLVAQEKAQELRRKALMRERQLEHQRQNPVSTPAAAAGNLVVPAPSIAQKLAETMQTGATHTIAQATTVAANAPMQLPFADIATHVDLVHKVTAGLLTLAIVSVAYTEGGALQSNQVQVQLGSTTPLQQTLSAAAGYAFSLANQPSTNTINSQPVTENGSIVKEHLASSQGIVDALSSKTIALNSAVSTLPSWVTGPSWLSNIAKIFTVPLSAAGYALSIPLHVFSSLNVASNTTQPTQTPQQALATSQTPSQTVVNNTYNTYNTTNNTTNNTTKNYATYQTTASSQQANGVSESQLQAKLNALADALKFQSYPNNVPSSGGAANNIALSQAIDNLNGTHLSNITVNGVSGLQASDIPNLSSSYLAVSGGTLTGALNISSSTATSTFADGINLTGGCFSINGTCVASGGGVSAGGSLGEVQFNNGGTLGGVTGLAFATSTGALGFGTTSPNAKFTVSESASDQLPTLLSISTRANGQVFSVATSGATNISNLFTSSISAPQSYTYTTSSNTSTSSSTFFSSSASTSSVYATNGFFGSLDLGSVNAFSASTTYATTSYLGIGNLNGILQANNGSVSASSTISVSFGGTGTSTAPNYGQLLIGNGVGGYNLVSTSSLGIISGGGSSNVSTSSQNIWSALQIFAGGATTSTFTATSSVYLTSLTNALLSTDQNGKLVATTTIGSNLLSVPANSILAGNSLGQLVATSSIGVNLLAGTLGIGNGGTGIAATPSYGQLLLGNGTGYTLTSTSSLGLAPAFSVSYPLLYSNNNLSLGFGTTSANTWSSLQIFNGGASSSGLSVFNNAYFGATATSSFNSAGQLSLAGLTNSILYANGTNQVGALSIGNGLSLTGGTLSLNTGNSNTWSALQIFGGGFIASASSTIGNGTQTGGLTISGGATTTGSALIGGNFAVNGSTNLGVLNAGNTILAQATTSNLAVTSLGNALLSTNGSGSVISTTIASPLIFSGNQLSIQQANATTNGFLASSDWTTFNNKISSTSLSASYPLAYNSSTGLFTLGFG